MWLGIMLGGCAEEPAAPERQVAPLTPIEHLVRASMAVRGIRPRLDELEAVRADPHALPGLVDDWLQSEAFGETIKDLHAELYLIRADTNYQLPVMGPLVDAGYNQADLHHSTVEAPLELVREVVMEDWPYTDILTVDYTVANDVVAAIYGLQYDPAGPEWQHTQWVDGRPQSGLLSDSEFWRRHVSNAANFHRGRANFVSRTFLCEDIGARDVFVAGGVDIADEFAVAEAVSTQTGCVGCHNVLDPLAAFFWGYKEQIQRNAVLSAYEMNCEWDWSLGPVPLGNGHYRPEHWCYPLKFYDVVEEDDWEYWGLRPPGFFGEPADTVVELGELIAADPRFAECTARSFAGYMEQLDRSVVPSAHTAELRQVFEESGFSAKALVKAIVLSEDFAAPATTGLLTARPEQLSRTIEDLTGFRWLANQDAPDCENNGNECWGAVNLLTSDVYGLRSMMGGIDSWTVTTPTHTPTPTKLLATSKLADEAAGYVVMTDFSSPPIERRLLSSVEADTLDENAVRAQLVSLLWRVLAQEASPDSELVTDLYGLWSAATTRSDPREGWRVVISALLQDPQLVFY
jgi:hypothetical protein